MSFNTAVSGLHAAHKRMEVAGNNIANVHTAGFKSSRAEFSAVYSSSLLGGSRTASGDGVQVANVSQNFAPGGVITSEGRALDMRIQGSGFFVMSDAGSISYGRSGAFIKDAQNFVVDSHGSRLQGYGLTDDGQVISGVRTDLKIDAAGMSPKATGKMEQTLNLNAGSPSLGAIPRFDPGDPTTYTRVTGRLIQDAGVPPQAHELKQYFVKTEDDKWTSYILVDGVNPLDPTSTAPLEIGLQVSAAGRLSLTGSTAAVKMMSDTELSLQTWRPAVNVNGSWTASPAPAPAPGPISLPLLDGGLPVLYPADPLMPRPVPTFNPADITTYTKASPYGVFDSLGTRHEMTQYFVKDGSNSWKMHTLIDGRNPQDPTSTAPSTASMLFDSGGSLQSLIGSQWLTAANNTLTLGGWVPAKPLDGNKPGGRWGANGAVGNADGIVMDFNKISQHNAATGSSNIVIDGHGAGQATQLKIDKSGMLMIGFSNGLHRNVGQVMLASFANNQGLQPVSDTRWVETLASGAANYDSPGVGTLGSVIGHSLEGSNVTLTNELVELIQAQTAYQANSKTLSTEAELMQTLIRAT
ncbi:flagellar hook protein FlgE [Pseudomonas petrae]|uniref:flagellar hook protein FlgE n=1 Tax=Pseudomonas petrae TaxID=2912190 RepID=UPI001EF0572D|nr:flagellar hook protein FlgE [Pseudomonas petrae]MCF7533895.1 flagellar hook-basal body complex protein [Pseudomonas petrae]MCF7555807.1 flagellar hook-basal body complex protein [Pseudomonas petrae]